MVSRTRATTYSFTITAFTIGAVPSMTLSIVAFASSSVSSSRSRISTRPAQIVVVIAEASTDREEILVGEVDLARIEDVRRGWPFLRDRRIDAYSGLDRRFLDPE